MAVTGHTYDNAPKHLVNGDVAFLSGTIKALLTNGYTFAAAHDTLADVKASAGFAEASGATSNYPAGGIALASKTITASGAVTTLDCADLAVTTNAGGSITATGVVFYLASGTDSTSFVLGYADFGGAQTASDTGVLSMGTPSGVATLTAAI